MPKLCLKLPKALKNKLTIAALQNGYSLNTEIWIRLNATISRDIERDNRDDIFADRAFNYITKGGRPC